MPVRFKNINMRRTLASRDVFPQKVQPFGHIAQSALALATFEVQEIGSANPLPNAFSVELSDSEAGAIVRFVRCPLNHSQI
jgi:hypothetical protein